MAIDRNIAAECEVGYRYLTGNGTPLDAAEGVRWTQLAADDGYAQAQCNMGIAYREGDQIKKNVPLAMQWFRKAIDSGYTQAKVELSVLLCAEETNETAEGKNIEREVFRLLSEATIIIV